MKNNAVVRLQDLLGIVPTLLIEISNEEFSEKSNVTKWSKKEILGHLVDSAANNHQRFIRIQYEDRPTIFYDQNKWNELNHYQQLECKHIIHFWTIYNQHLVEIIKRIPDTNLSKECILGNGEKATLNFLIDDYVIHLEHHLKQLINYNF